MCVRLIKVIKVLGETMTYKNSVKIMANNFSLCWKQLVWIIISVFAVFGISLLCATPVINMLKRNDFFVAVKDSFETIYSSPKDYPTSVNNVFSLFCDLIKSNAGSLWPSYLSASLSLVLLGNLFVCVGHYACSNVLFERMSNNARTSYTHRLIATFGRSILYSFVAFLFSVPFFAAIVGVFVLYVRLSTTTLVTLVLLPFATMIVYVIFAIHLSLSCATISCMLAGTKNPFKALGLSIKMASRRFARVFSSSLVLVLTIVFVNLFVGFFTIFAGLVITIPASVVLVNAFGLVNYFAAMGKSFYVSDIVVANLKVKP